MSSVLKAVKVKSCEDLVKKTGDALVRCDPKNAKQLEEVDRYIGAIKAILTGTGREEPSKEHFSQIAQEAYSTGLMLTLVQKVEVVNFEAKKDIVQVFNKLLRREIGTRKPTVDDVCKRPEILHELVAGYDKQQVDALSCGLMLRECIKSEALAKIVVNEPALFDKFFGYVQLATFDIAADAFTTFKDLLTAHKILAADFLEKQYDQVFGKYRELLESPNYVTKRQSLKLLGELLLDRANFTVMTKYISEPENLKLMMNMLRDKSKNIQFEAFHVFKVFVANPNKPKPIMDILLKNKSKLVDFLQKFHESRGEDEQFADEKSYLVDQIKALR